MRTQGLYLEDSYLREMDATVLEIKPEGNALWRLLLDKTVFYPMGGGQPTDQGRLFNNGWNSEVFQVLMKEGEIWHYVKPPIKPQVGMKLKGTINWDRRYRNMRVHSAGHIIDFAIYLLGYSPKTLIPLKGDHGKKPFILYQGSINKDIKREVEAKANELVEKNLTFSWLFQPFEQLQKEAIYLQPGLPTDKPLRTLRLASVGAVADGGTQVHSTKEVGGIIILNVEYASDMTTIRYTLAS